MTLKGKLQSLQSHLDGAASINFRDDPEFNANTLRWSGFAAPQPGAVINVATENDVQKTVSGIRFEYSVFMAEIVRADRVADEIQVQWAVQNGIKFVATNGTHGWTINWNITESDVIINLRHLNSVAVNLKEGYAIIEAGALVHEVIEAAYREKAHVGPCIYDLSRNS
jgi:hypothetical protein